MSNEIKVRLPLFPGGDLYAVIDDMGTGSTWNGTTFDAGLGTWSGYAVGLTEVATGVYQASIPAGINTTHTLSITVYRRLGASRVNTDSVVAAAVLDWTGSAIKTTDTPVLLNLSQALSDVKTGTTGGALNGAWATAFGQVILNRTTKILSVFGVGNTTGTGSATFQLDNAISPTTKTPLT